MSDYYVSVYINVSIKARTRISRRTLEHLEDEDFNSSSLLKQLSKYEAGRFTEIIVLMRGAKRRPTLFEFNARFPVFSQKKSDARQMGLEKKFTLYGRAD